MVEERLQAYRKLIDNELEVICDDFCDKVTEMYGTELAVPATEFCTLLRRGGKRIRGALLLFIYEAAGGKDQNAAVKAACAIEMLHAYILIIDDIQDRSETRRSGPTVHHALADKYSDSHVGLSLALNAALLGAHEAQKILAGLDVDSEIRLRIITYINETMILTAHGQTGDILNTLKDEVSAEDYQNVVALKTARYTFENPIAVGLLLAGKQAPSEITPFSEQLGQLFQITDDISGSFGNEAEIGKSIKDDMREGKRTLLVIYALQNLGPEDCRKFKQLLGKSDLSDDEFEQARNYIVSSGALELTKKAAANAAIHAKQSLNDLKGIFPTKSIQMLEEIINSLLSRTS